MTDNRIIFKNNIVKYLRQEMSDEGIDVLDVFKYDGNQSLQVTHFGYRHLKEYYTFLDVEFQFVYNVNTFGTLTRAVNGLFYYTIDKRDRTIKLYTTDHKFVNRLKLCGFDFNWMIKKFKISH